MSNALNMRCPAFGSDDRIDILAEVSILVLSDGTAADEAGCGDHRFTPDSTAFCACGHWATVAVFEERDAP
jgi:hypothetical protein